MRILLVSANALTFANSTRWVQTRRKFAYAPTTLTTLAALVPPELDADIRIIDEAVDVVPEDFWGADIVGISAMTPDAPRAYQLADRARLLGCTVVMGGYHATFCPDEAGAHSDAVVSGFAEESWPRLLRDYAQGKLRRLYRGPWQGIYANSLFQPRRDLLRRSSYLLPMTIEATRGCPNHCAFCTISPMHGGSYTKRHISAIAAEIDSMGARQVAFLDSNPFQDEAYARSLFAALRELGVKWYSAASLNTIRDREWIRSAAKGGCRGLLVGFESLQPESLRENDKTHNAVSRYAEACAVLHDEGIAILGCFIFGMDGDDTSVFDRTVGFVERSAVDLVLYSVYTPFPGTPARQRLERQRRIVSDDWTRYDGRHVVFRPAGMSVDQLQNGLFDAWEKTYRISSIAKRIVRSRISPFFDLVANLGFRMYRKTFLPTEAHEPAPAMIALDRGDLSLPVP